MKLFKYNVLVHGHRFCTIQTDLMLTDYLTVLVVSDDMQRTTTVPLKRKKQMSIKTFHPKVLGNSKQLHARVETCMSTIMF